MFSSSEFREWRLHCEWCLEQLVDWNLFEQAQENSKFEF